MHLAIKKINSFGHIQNPTRKRKVPFILDITFKDMGFNMNINRIVIHNIVLVYVRCRPLWKIPQQGLKGQVGGNIRFTNKRIASNNLNPLK